MQGFALIFCRFYAIIHIKVGDFMKLFDSFKSNKKLIIKTKFVNVYSVDCFDKNYTIIISKKVANKRTVIHFIDDTISWEQVPRFWRLAGRRYGDKIPVYKFDGKTLNTIFVVKGTPAGDEGLDNGIFRSPKKYDENFVNCMTYKKFKQM